MIYGSFAFHPTTLYILKMKTPKKYYVGTTTRHFLTRLGEHRNHMYCKWTRKHGLGRVVTKFSIDPKRCHAIENDVWMHLARQYGPHNVRGGDVTICEKHTDIVPDYLLPTEFGGTRIVDWGICDPF